MALTTGIGRIVRGVRDLFRRSRVDRDLDEELQAYLAAHLERKLAAGMAPAAAERAVRFENGSFVGIKERTREAGWEFIVETAWRDVRYAVRTLRRTPGFSAVAILTLALGLGASTAVFSVVDAVVLRGLPFDEHDRLVAVGTSRPSPFAVPLVTLPSHGAGSLAAIAPQDFLDWRERQQVFIDLAAYSAALMTLREPRFDPEELRALRVTSEFFDVLRSSPALGRPFARTHEDEGRHLVAIVSYGLWQRRFGGVPDIVGRTIQLDYRPYEILGVAPPGFTYPLGATRPTEIWVPLVIPPEERVRRPERYSEYLRAIGRLEEGVSLDRARTHMNAIARALEVEHPEWNKDRRVGMVPLHEAVVGQRTRTWMMLLLGSVALVLLIVCANVAGLLLARASNRDREMAIRAATGAGTGRLVRQLLIESVVLWATAAAVGVLFASWGTQVLKAAMPDGIPRVASIAMDVRILAGTAVVTIATALLFGLLPAMQLSQPNLARAFGAGGRSSSAGPGRQRLRNALVVAELALAVVLLVGAGLFVSTFRNVMEVRLGFDPHNVLAADLTLFRAIPGHEPPGWAALGELEARVRGIPGVEDAAAISGTIPFASSTAMTRLNIPGRPFSHEDTTNQLFTSSVTPGYHRMMRIPLRSGRYLDENDVQGAEPVMVINEAAAARFFPGENPVGRTLDLQKPRRIVGVVGDVRQAGFETAVAPTGYVPLVQGRVPGAPRSAQLLIRTDGDPLAVLPAVRAAVAAVLPGEPVRDARTLDDILVRITAQRRLSMLLLTGFGILGLVIAAVGLYGLMAYVVRQRTRELGIRVALGATQRQVIASVMRSGVALVTAGLVVGTGAAVLTGAAARAFLFGIEPTDPRVFAAALFVLAGSACAASVVPALRAAAIDPVTALREE